MCVCVRVFVCSVCVCVCVCARARARRARAVCPSVALKKQIAKTLVVVSYRPLKMRSFEPFVCSDDLFYCLL